MGVGHYENFPVASVLCPPGLRPPIVAIYRFARVADDIADEGDASAAARLEALADYRAALVRALGGVAPSGAASTASPDLLQPKSMRWPAVFEPLAREAAAFRLPGELLHALLDAFEQDVRNPPYPDREALLDYCRRSANPVGRLLLHLHHIADATSLARSDAICTALQLINFWQDLSVDGPRGRLYVPHTDAARHGVSLAELRERRDSPRARALVRELCDWAGALMRRGAPLALRVPGRAGWELRLVVQGGLRILDKLARIDHASLGQRPRLGAPDLPPMLWRAFAMTDAAAAPVPGAAP
ncbi:MAG: squalene synthase HpnC [Betaproteobacteria bacterium]|nr:squalene synthase HpnC [Betaproteobacteria bacterium]